MKKKQTSIKSFYFIVFDGLIWPIASNNVRQTVKYLSMALKFLLFILLFLLSGCLDNDVSKRAAEQLAVKSETHPYSCFWKKSDCKDRFGIAIAPAGEELYSLSFCGPGGCFEPGTYRPNSKIEGDSAYKIVDENTIEIKGKKGFSTYVRCERR